MRLRFLSALLPALLLAACATPGGYYSGHGGGYAPPQDGYARCANCGVVEKIDRVYGERNSSGGGAVLGGFLGNTIGGGTGRSLATAAGAVAGGVAGQGVQGAMNKTQGVELEIRKDDGNTIMVVQKQGSTPFSVGQRVAIAGSGSQVTVSPR